jgi:oligoribonuclease (3'-5' exoribonuclease)
MRYLSFDIEATGLEENDFIIEFAMIPFDAETMTFEEGLAREFIIKCPSFESLKPTLNPWVIQNNKALIENAHAKGIPISEFKENLKKYLESNEVKNYFSNKKIVLFGKSMNSIDLPFLSRDLGWEFTRNYFHHHVLDLSSVALAMIDLKMLPPECASGSALMKHLGYGEVAHTALSDSKNTAKMYFKLLEKFTVT